MERRLGQPEGWPFSLPRFSLEKSIHSPNSASVRPDHLLPGLAAKSLGKLRHVRNHVVDAEDRQRVRVGGNGHTSNFRTYGRAPRIGVRKEETLAIGPAVRTFVVERFTLLFQFGLEREQRQVNAPVVRRVLTLGQQAV